MHIFEGGVSLIAGSSRSGQVKGISFFLRMQCSGEPAGALGRGASVVPGVSAGGSRRRQPSPHLVVGSRRCVSEFSS